MTRGWQMTAQGGGGLLHSPAGYSRKCQQNQTNFLTTRTRPGIVADQRPDGPALNLARSRRAVHAGRGQEMTGRAIFSRPRLFGAVAVLVLAASCAPQAAAPPAAQAGQPSRPPPRPPSR